METYQWKREVIDAMLFLVFEYDSKFINSHEYYSQMNQLFILLNSQR